MNNKRFQIINFLLFFYFVSTGIAVSDLLEISLENKEIPYNRNYELRIYNSKRGCKDPTARPKAYQIYTQQSCINLKANVFDSSSLWAKVVEGKIDRSFCARGELKKNKIVFKLEPNNFGYQRIVLIIANSDELARSMGGRSIWYALMHTMISSFKDQKPVTLMTLNEDQMLDFVVQAEDLAHMYHSYVAENPYPELTKQIKRKVTLDQAITNPMKSLYSVHDYFKDKIKNIIYITGHQYVTGLNDLKINPYFSMMPLYWENNNIVFQVLTNGKCNVWENTKAKCYHCENIKLQTLKSIIFEK